MKKRTPKRITKSPVYRKAFAETMRKFSAGELYRSTGGKVTDRWEAQAIANKIGAAAQGVELDQYNRIIGPAGSGCGCDIEGVLASGRLGPRQKARKEIEGFERSLSEQRADQLAALVQALRERRGLFFGDAVTRAARLGNASENEVLGAVRKTAGKTYDVLAVELPRGSGADELEAWPAAHYNVTARGKKRMFVPFRGAAAELDEAGNVVLIIRPTKRDGAGGGDPIFAALARKFGTHNVERQRGLFAGSTEKPREIIGKAGQRDIFGGSGADQSPRVPYLSVSTENGARRWRVMGPTGPVSVDKETAREALDAARMLQWPGVARGELPTMQTWDGDAGAFVDLFALQRAEHFAKQDAAQAPLAFAPMPTAEPGEVVLDVPVEQIDADPDQPRKHFDPDALRELAESMRSIGQLQPVLVRPHPTARGRFMMVAGERRWRAAQKAGLPFLKAVVRELMGEQVAAAQLAENEVRRQTTESEAARFVVSRIGSGDSPEAIARALGRSPHWVETRVLIAKLSPELQAMLDAGKITVGTAAALGELPGAMQRNVLEAAQLHSKLGRGQEAYIRAVKLKEAGKDLFGQSIIEHVSGLSPKKRRALGNKLDRLLRCSGGVAALPDKDLLAMVESGAREPRAIEAEVTLLLRGLRRVLGSVEKVRAARAVGECVGVCQK